MWFFILIIQLLLLLIIHRNLDGPLPHHKTVGHHTCRPLGLPLHHIRCHFPEQLHLPRTNRHNLGVLCGTRVYPVLQPMTDAIGLHNPILNLQKDRAFLQPAQLLRQILQHHIHLHRQRYGHQHRSIISLSHFASTR